MFRDTHPSAKETTHLLVYRDILSEYSDVSAAVSVGVAEKEGRDIEGRKLAFESDKRGRMKHSGMTEKGRNGSYGSFFLLAAERREDKTQKEWPKQPI